MIIIVSCSYCMVMSWDVVCTCQQKSSGHSQLFLIRMTIKKLLFQVQGEQTIQHSTRNKHHGHDGVIVCTLDDGHHTGTSEIVQQLKVVPHH